MKRVERVRLYPTRRQMASLQYMLDVTREIYNAALQERRDAYRFNGVNVTAGMQYGELTEVRAEDARLRAVYRECEDAALWRIELAMRAFFRRVKRGEAPGFPRFKSAARWKQIGFQHGGRALTFDKDQRRVRVPGVGSVALRKSRRVPEAFGRAWIIERNGRWHLCAEYEVEEGRRRPIERLIAIDRGVHVLVATSDGQLFRNAAVGERGRATMTRLQRRLEAVTVRSADRRVLNWHDPVRKAAVHRLARSREREANVRRDFLHKLSRRLVDAYDAIAIEALNLRAMTRSARGTIEKPGRNVKAKSALNRRILDASFGLLQQMIAYKAASAGTTIVVVDPRFSSQTCWKCGHCDRDNRRRRRFACRRCGFTTHADIAAALEIRRRAQLALSSEPHTGEEPVTPPGDVRHPQRYGKIKVAG